MNDYQKAFEHLIKHLETLQKFYVLDNGTFLKEDYEHDKALIKELVDKSTPKKICHKEWCGMYGVLYDLCPSCETNLCTAGLSGRPKMKYCEKCGQALDWSKDEK